MSYDVVLKLPKGDQIDLEVAFCDYMVDLVESGKMVVTENNYWGQSYILQGSNLHAIQWKFILEEEYDEDDNLISLYFEDGFIDIEVDCSWCEEENYGDDK